MFKNIYKIGIDGDQSDKAFKSFCAVLGDFGKIEKIEEVNLTDDDTNDPVCSMIIFDFKASRKRFNRMIKIFRKIDFSPVKIGDIWFI